MTPEQIEALGPAFADYLQPFLFCCGYTQTFDLLGVYCRGLLSDLPARPPSPSPWPRALPSVPSRSSSRIMPGPLTASRHLLQQHVAARLPSTSADDLGTVGLIDETGTRKHGSKTPGVQRQYCGELGKIENCIVTVHLGVVPAAATRRCSTPTCFCPSPGMRTVDRCQAAGIPDSLHYRPKWQIALEQLDRAAATGWSWTG